MLKVLRRKLKTAKSDPRIAFVQIIDLVLKWLLGMPCMAFVWLLRPIIKIRFCFLDIGRIGHFAGTLNTYLCDRNCGLHNDTFDVFYSNVKPVNKFLYFLSTKEIRFLRFGKYIADAASHWTIWQQHLFKPGGLDFNGNTTRVPAPIVLDEKHVSKGDQWLESIGIPINQPILLFSNRDSAHLDKIKPNTDWSYHNHRDSSIDNMLLMADRFVEKGYAAIRIGADVSQAIDRDNSGIVDYPNNGRTDERDVYLSSRCKFMIGTASGTLDFARLFHKPAINCNVLPLLGLGYFHAPKTDIWIPKLHWLIKEERLLSFQEIIDLNSEFLFHSNDFEEKGIKLIENTPEEILDLAIEAEIYIDERKETRLEDQALLDAFWNIVLQGSAYDGQSQISVSFLKRHPQLLA